MVTDRETERLRVTRNTKIKTRDSKKVGATTNIITRIMIGKSHAAGTVNMKAIFRLG